MEVTATIHHINSINVYFDTFLTEISVTGHIDTGLKPPLATETQFKSDLGAHGSFGRTC